MDDRADAPPEDQGSPGARRKMGTAAATLGRELRDRTLGVIGFGGIARKLIDLLAGWGMKQPLAFDPFMDAAGAAKIGVKLVPLDELLKSSDFVSIHCPLTEKTHGLIGSRELALMKPDAYLINSARGGIVDEMRSTPPSKKTKSPAPAFDCFAKEPVTEPNRFGQFENVLLAPQQHRVDERIVPRHRPRRVPGNARSLAASKTAEGRAEPGTVRSREFPEEVGTRICGQVL